MTDDTVPEALAQLRDAHRRMKDELHRVIVGQEEVIDQILLAVLTRGHCLLVGVPGLAKTVHAGPDAGDITGTEVMPGGQDDRGSAASSS